MFAPENINPSSIKWTYKTFFYEDQLTSGDTEVHQWMSSGLIDAPICDLNLLMNSFGPVNIALGDTLDSYLYLGKIYYLQKDYDTALSYFRQRVRNSYGKGDKIKYQALKGIRNSLREKRKITAADSLKATQQETDHEHI